MFQLNAKFQMSLANALLNYLHSLLSSYFYNNLKYHILHIIIRVGGGAGR